VNAETDNAEKQPLVFLLSQFWLRLGLKIWNRFRAIGSENMPARGGVIIASNHASFMDPPIVGCGLLHRYVRFMARDTLFQNRIGQWWFESVGVVSINRNRGDIAAFKAALSVLRSGGALCLFPEGTRTLDGNLQKPKSGIGFLIMKSEVPVLPVYIEGSFSAFPKGAKWIRPAKITVRYGPLITQDEFKKLGSGKDLYEKATDLVMARIAELKSASSHPARAR
jgi:1-acyl-sn-glycerol-3-phosphate acyltransferase